MIQKNTNLPSTNTVIAKKSQEEELLQKAEKISVLIKIADVNI